MCTRACVSVRVCVEGERNFIFQNFALSYSPTPGTPYSYVGVPSSSTIVACPKGPPILMQ